MLFKLHELMAVVADNGIVFMRLMTHYTFKVVRFRNMVVMRVELKSLVIVGSLGNRIPRTMVLACKAGLGRRGRLGIGFSVMADAARYAAILVPIRRGLLFLGFLAYSRPDNQQGDKGRKANRSFHHDSFILAQIFICADCRPNVSIIYQMRNNRINK
jgi:hypothetical protein